MGNGYYYEKAKKILDAFHDDRKYSEINQVIEFYNIYNLFMSKSIKEEFTKPYEKKVKHLMKIVAIFFKSIDDMSFAKQFNSVCISYIDDFWILFDEFKVYENVSENTFKYFLNEYQNTLYRILKHKNVVQYYDAVLSEYMRTSNQTAEIIIEKFLEKKDPNSKTSCFIPFSLKPYEFESILNKYLDSDDLHIGKVQILALSQSSAECPISDELRLKAKRKTEIYWKKRAADGEGFFYTIDVCFRDSEEIFSESFHSSQYKFTYDTKWIRENLDYPTLLNNFIYLFAYTDLHFRCKFPSVKTQLGIFEKIMGIKGIKEYETGVYFQFIDMKSSAEMQQYITFLSSLNIYIEDIYKWFFTQYLREEFNVLGFVFNPPSSEHSFLEKCRNLPSEMDGILKQYKLYVENQEIDRDLLEISSNPVIFGDLPSMIKNKYAYANSEEIQKELFLLFSDQSMLGYLEKSQESFNNFVEALSAHELAITNYSEWEINEIRWLENRGSINIDSNGTIRIYKPRVSLLHDLYIHDVICPSYYKDKSQIESLILSGDLLCENSLFSIPEQKYFNFILNKAEYSNGLDLRNKYIHSTYPLDVRQQERDYIYLLKIMAVIIIKINEEFCLKYPIK